MNSITKKLVLGGLISLALITGASFAFAQDSTVAVSLFASPTSGTAPLRVSFSYSLQSVDANVVLDQYSIDFGDGTQGKLEVGCDIRIPGAGACMRALIASHTYAKAGTYTATLVHDMCGRGHEGDIRCLAPEQIFGSVTITVRGSGTTPPPEPTVCTMDAMQCPDGSWVGRSGPNCQFMCPGPETVVEVDTTVSVEADGEPSRGNARLFLDFFIHFFSRWF